MMSVILALVWFITTFYCAVETDACASGDIRLVGGPNEFEGRVEICFDGVWGQVCGRGWHREDGEVVCRQLGYIIEESGQSAVSNGNFYGVGDGPAQIANVTCDGTESTLSDCTYDVAMSCSSIVAQVVCQDPMCFDTPEHVRLVGGDSETEGRVEICSSAQFRRGVCDNNWDERDASVVCRELGLPLENEDATFGGAIRYKSFVFDDASCDGTEQRISHCTFGQQVNGRLTRCDFAGVVCRSNTSMPITPLVTPVPTPRRPESSQLTTASETRSREFTRSTVVLQPTNLQPTPQEDLQRGNATLLAAVFGSIGGIVFILMSISIAALVIIITKRRMEKADREYLNETTLNNATQPAAEQTGIEITGNAVAYQSNIASRRNEAYSVGKTVHYEGTSGDTKDDEYDYVVATNNTHNTQRPVPQVMNIQTRGNIAYQTVATSSKITSKRNEAYGVTGSQFPQQSQGRSRDTQEDDYETMM